MGIQIFVPTFGFGTTVDLERFHGWFRGVWWWSFVFSAAYVLLVFGGRRLMRDREPFRLRVPLVMWNVRLAVFSFVCALRLNTTLIHSWQQHGFVSSLCLDHTTKLLTSLWSPIVAFSKLVEFGDTAFIVLRKQPLIFLHWYHHVITCVYSWYVYAFKVIPSRYYTAMNAIIHFVMYSYYAARAAGFRPPKALSIVITTAQTLQMVAGLYITAVAHMAVQAGEPCGGWSNFDSLLTAFMYGSYFLLFLRFFFKSYVKKSPRSKKE